MPRQQQDADAPTRLRARANTTSFPTFGWGNRPRPDQSTPPAPPVLSTTQPVLSLDELIEALSPPSQPSLTHARSLASMLATYSPLPRRAALNPVLGSLCDAEGPIALQAVGFEILATYCEHNEAPPLSTSERLTYFALFQSQGIPWAMELWEPRFKALRALTRFGSDLVGIESPFLDLLKSWIEGGFDGLLTMEPMRREERSERERSIDVMAGFLTDVVENPETIARISEEELASITHFYTSLVNRSIVLPPDATTADKPTSEVPSSSTNTPSKQGHKRHPSSLSNSSTPVSTAPTPPTKQPFRHPADLAITLYLNHLAPQLKTSSHMYLKEILPALFRALGFIATPLSKLSVVGPPPKKPVTEERVTNVLNSLFTGPYASTCMRILKDHLSPLPANLDDIVTTPSPTKSDFKQANLASFPDSLCVAFKTAKGAHRMLRNYVRRALSTRLARAYIMRETSTSYSYSGAPGSIVMEKDLMERAWPPEDYITTSGLGNKGNGWDAARLGKALASSVDAWVLWHSGWDPGLSNTVGSWVFNREREEKEAILEEDLGLIRDILQEIEATDEGAGTVDEEEMTVVEDVLSKLANYVLPLRNPDGTPFILPLHNPDNAPTSFLRQLASLLSREHTEYLNPLLPGILVEIADNLSDSETARLINNMLEQHDLTPTSQEWLDTWSKVLGNFSLLGPQRPLTRTAVMDALENVYSNVKDMKFYRRPLADLVWEFCNESVSAESGDYGDAVWRVLGEEVVLRIVEYDGDDLTVIEGEEAIGDNEISVGRYIALLVLTATSPSSEDPEEEEGDNASILTPDTASPTPHTVAATPSVATSPLLSRMQSELHAREREDRGQRETGFPGAVMSILTSLTNPSRSQSIPPQVPEEPEEMPTPPSIDQPRPLARGASAVCALVNVFSQLAFTPFVLNTKNMRVAIKIYETLIHILAEGRSTRARLTVLQFLSRLRSDRDHKVYFSQSGFDVESHVATLSGLINRLDESAELPFSYRPEAVVVDTYEPPRKARPRMPQDFDRDGRQMSRGRGMGFSHSTASRSRSRTAGLGKAPVTPKVSKPKVQLWRFPETLPFTVAAVDSPSEALVSYDVRCQDTPLLPVSLYLSTMLDILEKERDWEICSYVLCHLPIQLANKHFFCGPKSKVIITRMMTTIATRILDEKLGTQIVAPLPFRPRDAQGLAFHTLSVLISYKRGFDTQQRHLLVEALQVGLNGQPSTIKCCLHALTLAAFELQSSVTRYLPHIMEKLSQIMSNPYMAVHILGFLSIIPSQPNLYANFTENDYKTVFGVALQYLQHYNRLNASPTTSWALSQHVRILTYYILYVWFLALKLPDRPSYIKYITRQLLIANEMNDALDGPTEVCFDWLSRYTYASADPRPAHSLMSEVVMNPVNSKPYPSDVPALSEKTWIAGNSVMTIRALARLGWIEVISRRPSGLTKFLCHVENVPVVGPGDVGPDRSSLPAALLMNRQPTSVVPQAQGDDEQPPQPPTPVDDARREVQEVFASDDDSSDKPPRPDPITGYVWSGTAPSQRRKEVVVDPSFFALQLTPYPDNMVRTNIRMVHETSGLAKFFSMIDRMPVIDTHKVGIMYVAPGQTNEVEILRNTHGSPAYARFLEGIGRLINLRGQQDVYVGGLDPDEDGEYAYAWWDDIGQILYHTATMMPNSDDDPYANYKKRHIGNDYVRIVWNDSGKPYRFDTLSTQFQFVNIVIEPHSLGAIAAFSNNVHENEYFKVTVQRAPGMMEFTPVGQFKVISAENLPLLVRQLSLLSDWFASVFANTQNDTVRVDVKTNWQNRLEAIRRFQATLSRQEIPEPVEGIMGQEAFRDFTTTY
ncbi:hypothetical protein AX16_001115 [Volvariella volvacea WC 439]|nr:hypothetical protein AX16_001115 [Volvariella volvacea WC 439]